MKYQICSATVMDNTADPNIRFDAEGVCQYCHAFKKRLQLRVPTGQDAEKQLAKIINRIQGKGRGKKYDCIIGVSGGVDSSYLCIKAKDLGLRPLAVHVDNGWNTPLAVQNMERMLTALGIDLYTEVVDWDAFKDLQKSFLLASTPDGEIPTDHIILATLFETARKNKVRYVLTGMNFRTEGMLPPGWANGHLDWNYISSVHKIYGSKSICHLPHFGIFRLLSYYFLHGIKMIGLLNYLPFERQKVMAELSLRFGFKAYDQKHHESAYTRFFQSYILPRKFGIDKRRAHLSCLIMGTGELTRNEALLRLQLPAMTEEEAATEKAYICKKLGLNERELNDLMCAPIRSIHDFSNSDWFFRHFRKVIDQLRHMKKMPN